MRGNGAEEKGSGSAFEAAVRLAYQEEHGDASGAAIGRRMGIGRSAIHQLLHGPRRFEERTLQKFLGPIRSEARRGAILEAYNAEAFSREPVSDVDRPRAALVKELAEQNRPEAALEIAWEGLDGNLPEADRVVLFLLALNMSFRLDAPGETMRLAERLRQWGRAEDRPERVAASHAANARAMRRSLLFTLGEARAERDRVGPLLAGLRDLSRERLALAAFARDTVESEYVNGVLMAHEAGGGEEETLRNHLESMAARRKDKALSKLSLFRALQLEGRVRLALGELDRAEGCLEDAKGNLGDDRRALMECSQLEGRLLADRGRFDEAEDHLCRAAVACERDRYVFLQRLAQSELARLALRRMEKG